MTASSRNVASQVDSGCFSVLVQNLYQGVQPFPLDYSETMQVPCTMTPFYNNGSCVRELQTLVAPTPMQGVSPCVVRLVL
jgi:hypothetical protein